MSRNSKNARRTEERKQWSKVRLGGGKGPSRTTPKKDKKFSYRSPPPHIAKDRQEKVAGIMGKTRPASVIEQLKEGKSKQPKAKNMLLKKEVEVKTVTEADLLELEILETETLEAPLDLLEKLEEQAFEAILAVTAVPHKLHDKNET